MLAFSIPIQRPGIHKSKEGKVHLAYGFGILWWAQCDGAVHVTADTGGRGKKGERSEGENGQGLTPTSLCDSFHSVAVINTVT